MNNKTSCLENGLIWFGAALSLAEIHTGMSVASLGFKKGIFAIVAGHIIGSILLFFAGLIGGRLQKSSMETSKSSFGKNGSKFFALLNTLQLVGWTAIMIYDGAIAANAIFDFGISFWCIVTGLLICLWIFVGIKDLGKLNIVAMTLLFILTIVLSIIALNKTNTQLLVYDAISFGTAVELSVAMPLSWLPLISDYTKDAKDPLKASLVSSVTYGVTSSWMYIIGMSLTIFTGTSDIAQAMIKSGLGISALLIVILSTVTTTFLDAYSAGLSFKTIFPLVSEKWIGIIVALFGIIAAIVFPLNNITDFLYLIGSVFAPMIAIQISDFYILKKDHSNKNISVSNILIWLIGFILYRLSMGYDILLGNTFPVMIIVVIISFVFSKIRYLNKL